ncbi:Glucoamylase (glucan-1,4-alpha-glucosidase), GH15 family [Tistlia consotensis]|uniref:Trehalase n=1 Tax=Tistlia consotensis USBA 355 TaxID=560819 RepID=A0A1Y6BLV2_9PROT|nr:glycoside hydrolase family 15 protein [Tistlia consotensis]SMF14160.1 Glucoamylase (glucan-1,4-alpha-glucosidase), GH15 family [Tistlia consotensis USBA 355]SNR49794.1 Glucoamylase (glucan-1,4-alpha-glucosidase), GH15 family [Tistlia consotensis]
MSKAIEDYGFIGNLRSCALVGRDGSIDWLCLPRFDSDACFAALLGTGEHGRWLLAPAGEVRATSRRYLPGTPILETTFETAEGKASVTDFMPLGGGVDPDGRTGEVVRLVKGLEGRVEMTLELVLRFGYGRTVPWVRRRDYGLRAVAGPDAVEFVTPVRLRGEDMKTRADFAVETGESVPFTLSYHPSIDEPRFVDDREVLLQRTAGWWREWSERCTLPDPAPEPWREAVRRSLITLKAMSFEPTGGLVAAPTASLPEQLGGSRNWDYRYCWIRDATVTLYALVNSGYFEEAGAFRNWLLRAAAGDPGQMQIMYGLGGERRLTEVELPWLPGYAGSRPVRIGNGAHGQRQLDVFGELMDALHLARRSHLGPYKAAWRLQGVLLDQLGELWREPDEGIWEVRGGRRHFTYSKMMCWVAFDRGIKAVESFGLEGPVEDWKRSRDEIRADILARGYDAERNTLVQSYGSKALDASLLLAAEVGFLAADDRRYRGTVEAIERELLHEGFVRRYRTDEAEDGLSGEEGTFLVCSFWLADAYVLLGRLDDAIALFDRLLAVRNDLGLLAEEYDPKAGRQLGNFPQAFSHVGLVNTAHNLLRARGPARQRANHGALPQSSDASVQTEATEVEQD